MPWPRRLRLAGADIEATCSRASMLAIREFLENQRRRSRSRRGAEDYSLKITSRHFRQATSEISKAP
jgi:SpoVK/Ycf46/Vps4 family AAA+-type ATPase